MEVGYKKRSWIRDPQNLAVPHHHSQRALPKCKKYWKEKGQPLFAKSLFYTNYPQKCAGNQGNKYSSEGKTRAQNSKKSHPHVKRGDSIINLFVTLEENSCKAI